jgi:hypothetical protein
MATLQKKLGCWLVVCWYKATSDREQDLWRYWAPESCFMKWYIKPTGDHCLCKKCELGEQWNSDIAVSRTLAKHCDIWIENTNLETFLFSPPTWICSAVAYRSLLPLLFLRCLIILSHCPISNITSCHQDNKLFWTGLISYDPHTRFHYSNLLTYLCHDYGSFSNFSGMNLGGSVYKQVLNWPGCYKHFWHKNYMIW